MPSDDDVYNQVVARGRGLRRRRRRYAIVGSGTAFALVIVTAAALSSAVGDDGSESVRADAPVSTPAPALPGCRNSRDPACGPFYWDPLPANEPVTFTVTFAPAHPVAGEPVTLTVEAHDPEAEILILDQGDGIGCSPNWGDGGVYAPGCGETLEGRYEASPRTGPWDPPPPVGASASATFEHTYEEPGVYTVTVYARPLTSEAARNTPYDVYGPTGADQYSLTIAVG